MVAVTKGSGVGGWRGPWMGCGVQLRGLGTGGGVGPGGWGVCVVAKAGVGGEEVTGVQ